MSLILYEDDLAASEVGNERLQFADFVDAFEDEQLEMTFERIPRMYQLIRKKRVRGVFYLMGRYVSDGREH